MPALQPQTTPHHTAFRKRTFSPMLFAACSLAALVHLPTLLRAGIKPRTSPGLRTKIMLASSQVNACRYCTWVHTSMALKEGVDVDTLSAVLAAESLGSRLGSDEVAVLFTKHYIDSQRHPSNEAVAVLHQHWRADQVREIMAYIHGIYFSNLCGNSMDAWLARLRGGKVESGHPITEAIAALVVAPSLWLIVQKRNKGRLTQTD